MITGEYLVLDGAKALAVPTKQGQLMSVKPTDKPKIIWKSYDETGKLWFDYNFSIPITPRKSDTKTTALLKNVFLEIQRQNPTFFQEKMGYTIETRLEFPRNWGLGSSSTLLYNLATWAKVDRYSLLKNTMGGSGYDIACAGSENPIFYQIIDGKPKVEPVNFLPKFAYQLYFVHLNQKQRSSREVKRYQQQSDYKKNSIPYINDITNLITQVTDLEDFETLLQDHEFILSKILHREPIQRKFKDYFGQLKSLGAWGGDFILATGNEDTPNYFKNKGFPTVIPYREMVL